MPIKPNQQVLKNIFCAKRQFFKKVLTNPRNYYIIIKLSDTALYKSGRGSVW